MLQYCTDLMKADQRQADKPGYNFVCYCTYVERADVQYDSIVH